MSEPHEEQNPPKQAEAARLDATTAAAALALAVKSAEKSSGKPTELASDKTRAALLKIHRSSPVSLKYVAQAAAIAIVIGVASAVGSHAVHGVKQAPQLPESAATALSGIRQNQEDVVRLSGDVRVLKDIVEAMKESFDLAKGEAAGQQRALVERALVERVERIERAAQETTAQIAHLLEASGRIERASADAGAKLVALSGRLDDTEKQKAAAVKSAATSAEGPEQTGSVPEKAAKDRPLDGWVLRDVFAGVALVESRGGRLHEVVPGTRLPNVGRVEAIERRGRTWVVVTSKGIIGAPERWQ
jgi:hypothetical protein